jgi:flagellar basal body P-ring formation protein FlgA
MRMLIVVTLAAAAIAAPASAQSGAEFGFQAGARIGADTTLPPTPAALEAPFAVPTLRRSVVVTSEIVRIGDLIDNAGGFAAIPVFRSPDVGTTGAVPARKVVEAARAHNLFGVETGDVIAVDVTRAGRVITRKELEARIVRLLSGTNGLGGISDLTLNFDRIPANINADLPPDADLKAMRASYEARTGRFDVVFDVPVGVSRRTLLRYTGTLIETADAVVPNRTIGRGEVIRAGDLAVERRPRAEVTGEVPATIAEVAGRAARQALRQGVPVRRTDLAKPEMVKRDDNVNLIYEVPGILLTTRGKALESGGEGDLISVLNPQSKRTVQGIVTGFGRVDISPVASRPVIAAASQSPDPASSGTE